MNLRRFPLWVALWFLLTPVCAVAQPSLWDRAREPQLGRAERVLVRMERVFDGVSQASGDADMVQDFRQGTIVVAEMSGARALGDPRLEVLLAESLLGLEGQSDADVQALLDQALSRLEPRDVWLEAKIRPLLALASRQSPTEAQSLLTKALAWAWQPSLRSLLWRSRADARMALADVRGSLHDARAALAVAETASQRALSTLALALALERGGDQPAAFVEFGRARLLAVSGPRPAEASSQYTSVFRPLDTDYVTALSEMELAQSIDDDAPQELEHLQQALAAWATYVRSAAPSDPWLGAARAHLRECERRRRVVVKAAG